MRWLSGQPLYLVSVKHDGSDTGALCHCSGVSVEKGLVVQFRPLERPQKQGLIHHCNGGMTNNRPTDVAESDWRNWVVKRFERSHYLREGYVRQEQHFIACQQV